MNELAMSIFHKSLSLELKLESDDVFYSIVFR
jgi:hypothetical protein